MLDEPDESTDAPVPDGASILRARSGQLPLEPFAQILMDCAGMMKADATAACAHGRGILVVGIAPEEADATARALHEVGEKCWALPVHDLVAVPRAKPVHSAHLHRSGLTGVDAAGHEESHEWAEAVALALGHVTVRATHVEVGSKSPLARDENVYRLAAATGAGGFQVAGLLGAAGAMPVPQRSVEEKEAHTFLEIAFGTPPQRFRVDARQFDYSLLGDQLQNSSEVNLRTLARWLIHAAPHVRTNFDAQALMQTGQTKLRDYPSHEFDEEVRWLVNLARVA
jgi:hypothetical protein